MVASVKSIRAVRMTGRKNCSTIIALDPEIVRRAGLVKGTNLVQEYNEARNEIRLKPLRL